MHLGIPRILKSCGQSVPLPGAAVATGITTSSQLTLLGSAQLLGT